MAASKKYKASVKTAKTDSVLVAIAKRIREHNGRHAEAGWTPDTFSAGVYRDRAADLGMWVPNEAYWSIFMGMSMSA